MGNSQSTMEPEVEVKSTEKIENDFNSLINKLKIAGCNASETSMGTLGFKADTDSIEDINLKYPKKYVNHSNGVCFECGHKLTNFMEKETPLKLETPVFNKTVINNPNISTASKSLAESGTSAMSENMQKNIAYSATSQMGDQSVDMVIQKINNNVVQDGGAKKKNKDDDDDSSSEEEKEKEVKETKDDADDDEIIDEEENEEDEKEYEEDEETDEESDIENEDGQKLPQISEESEGKYNDKYVVKGNYGRAEHFYSNTYESTAYSLGGKDAYL